MAVIDRCPRCFSLPHQPLIEHAVARDEYFRQIKTAGAGTGHADNVPIINDLPIICGYQVQ